jgi:TRAP-type C4-dicarboxylate transport system permease small subunit
MKTETDKDEVNNPSLEAHASNEVSSIERNLSKITNGLEKIIYPLNKVAHKASKVILFLLMFLTTGDVVGRYFFNKPITGTYEVTGLGLALIIFFSLGMAQLEKNHIAIDFLTNKFPTKIRESLNAFTSLILFVLLLLTNWQLIEYTKRIIAGNELSGDLGIPLYIFTSLASIGALFFALTILLDIFKSLLKVVQKNES